MTHTTHLDIGVEDSLNFLRAWRAWLANLQRPRMLHHVVVCNGGFKNTPSDPDLKPLAEQLDGQLWGLLPGFHRLTFEGGQVLLTICIGTIAAVLKQQKFEADSVFLNTRALYGVDMLYTVKAIARLCKRGSTIAVFETHPELWSALKQCGFENSTTDARQAVYNPAWLPEKSAVFLQPASCIVIGAGLAGSAVASSLARRGWEVVVLDAANHPASGASSLPAGLLVAHTSPDDNPLSRLSRVGVRITLHQARNQLRHGTDWGQTGVLQRRFSGEVLNLPLSWAKTHLQAAHDWQYPASAKSLRAAGLPPDSQALWHEQAGWIKPAALVKAWLNTPGVDWRGNAKVAQLLAPTKPAREGWQAINDAGEVLAQADMVVLSAGHASGELAVSAGLSPPVLQALRGQVTTGLHGDCGTLPPFAVNGHGGLISWITTADGPIWLMGASYERDADKPAIKPQDHAANFERLQCLLPETALALEPYFDPRQAEGWAGIRCATPNRLPLLTQLVPSGSGPGLWLYTGLGSRGLSFAALGGELLAARLHGEPLPIDSQLARAMGLGIF